MTVFNARLCVAIKSLLPSTYRISKFYPKNHFWGKGVQLRKQRREKIVTMLGARSTTRRQIYSQMKAWLEVFLLDRLSPKTAQTEAAILLLYLPTRGVRYSRAYLLRRDATRVSPNAASLRHPQEIHRLLSTGPWLNYLALSLTSPFFRHSQSYLSFNLEDPLCWTPNFLAIKSRSRGKQLVDFLGMSQ